MEFVISRYPKAVCQGYAGRTFISFHIQVYKRTIGIGDTVRGAWRDAAAVIRRVERTAK